MPEKFLTIPTALYRWLRAKNINPDKVKLILRCDDDFTHTGVLSCLIQDFDPLDRGVMSDIKQLKMHGISISITSLDSSRG